MADWIDRALFRAAGWPVVGGVAERALGARGTIPFVWLNSDFVPDPPASVVDGAKPPPAEKEVRSDFERQEAHNERLIQTHMNRPMDPEAWERMGLETDRDPITPGEIAFHDRQPSKASVSYAQYLDDVAGGVNSGTAWKAHEDRMGGKPIEAWEPTKEELAANDELVERRIAESLKRPPDFDRVHPNDYAEAYADVAGDATLSWRLEKENPIEILADIRRRVYGDAYRDHRDGPEITPVHVDREEPRRTMRGEIAYSLDAAAEARSWTKSSWADEASKAQNISHAKKWVNHARDLNQMVQRTPEVHRETGREDVKRQVHQEAFGPPPDTTKGFHYIGANDPKPLGWGVETERAVAEPKQEITMSRPPETKHEVKEHKQQDLWQRTIEAGRAVQQAAETQKAPVVATKQAEQREL